MSETEIPGGNTCHHNETVMKTVHAILVWAAFVLVMAVGGSHAFGQPAPGVRDEEQAIPRVQRQEKIQQVQSDKAGYADAIVAR